MEQSQEANAPSGMTGSSQEKVGTILPKAAPPGMLPFVWLGLMALALVARALIYFRVENVLHAEEAVQGLMGRHILGGSIQIFTYGYPYLGTLQAHLLALSQAIFGSSVAVLKWTAGFESLLLIVANYLLARDVAGGDRRAGLIAAFLTAVGPLYLIEWSLRPRGGHLEVATLSALAFWALLRAFRATPVAPRLSPLKWLALCAFLLGLGWWVHLTMFYAITTCAIALAVWGGRLRVGIRAGMIAGVCFLVGSLPFWLYNVKYPGRTFARIWSLICAGGVGPGVLGRAVETARASVPIFLGSRQTEAASSFGAVMVLASVVATVLAIGAAIAAIRRPRADSAVEANRESAVSTPRREGVLLLLIFSVIALAVFILGPSADQSRDPRPLLPLYGALPPLMGVGMAVWLGAGGFRNNAAMAILVALALVNVGGYRRAERKIVQPKIQGQPVPTSLEPLRDCLEIYEITLLRTHFYLGYRLTFETGEQVIASSDNDPDPERYPPYAEKVRASEKPVAFLVGSHLAEWMEADLKQRGIGFAETAVQDLRLFHNLTAPYRDYPPGPQMCASATIVVGAYDKQAGPDEVLFVKVTVTNRSMMAWPAPPNWRAVWLSYHVLNPRTGRTVRYDYPRFSLGKALEPGQSATVILEVETPRRPGLYVFVPDLLIEEVAWFSAFHPDLVAKPNWREFSVGTRR